MPRSPRIQEPGASYHVTALGVDRCSIALDATDYETLLAIVSAAISRHEWTCLSYCLMGTHFHLLVRTPDTDLDRGMHFLNSLYAQAFNRRHGRKGHLFGDRYYSRLVDEEPHLLEVVRYVALNPVRANVCSAPEDWPWSSYAGALGLRSPRTFVSDHETLALFAPRSEAARRLLREFVWPAGRAPGQPPRTPGP